MRKPKSEDIADALDHASDFVEHLRLDDFTIAEPKIYGWDALWYYDDMSGWLEWEQDELTELSRDELISELEGFRGGDFAQRATRWIDDPDSMPPVIIISTDEYTEIADGRGRVSVALGLGWKGVPAVLLTNR